MRKVVKGVGGFDHAQWRAFSNVQRTEPAKNFVDGDLIEQFLDLRCVCVFFFVAGLRGGCGLSRGGEAGKSREGDWGHGNQMAGLGN